MTRFAPLLVLAFCAAAWWGIERAVVWLLGPETRDTIALINSDMGRRP